MTLALVATCALGLEELVAGELRELGMAGVEGRRGAVAFAGGWREVWRANWRLRTANRVLVELGAWNAPDGDALAAGAGRAVEGQRSWDGVSAADLFDPRRSFAVRATSSRSQVRDTRWVGLRVKDGIVDAQRRRFGKRASVERRDPDVQLRVWLHRDRATLLLDTSGAPLDHRGYRVETTEAPVREQLAAACVLAAGWDGRGPVVDPMCGSGTLLAEAAAWALGLAPGRLRDGWAFEALPGFDRAAWEAVRREPIPAPAGGAGSGPEMRLHGVDAAPEAIAAATANLERAGLLDRATLTVGDAFDYAPPPGPGLLLVNPPYGERLAEEAGQWPRLGDLMKQRYGGWRAVVLAGGASRGKHLGLRPERRIAVRTGPLDARILPFALY
jgi:putative N6-adenine-specific DNA methylase